YSSVHGDCNDGNAFVNPGMPEVCDDGIDNSCSLGGLYDCDNLSCTGDAACAPEISKISPNGAKYDEPKQITITGKGFDYWTAGVPSVTFSGGIGECVDVNVVDNATLT